MYLHCDYCEREVQGVRRGWDEVAHLGKVGSAVGMLVKAPPELTFKPSLEEYIELSKRTIFQVK